MLLRTNASDLFVVTADEVGGDAVEGLRHTPAVAVVEEGGDHDIVFLDFHQVVFGVVAESERVCSDDSGGLVPLAS